MSENTTLYLLKTSQLNGYHAALFTYCIYIKLKKLRGNFLGKKVTFSVFSENRDYRIQIAKTDFSEIANLENTFND